MPSTGLGARRNPGAATIEAMGRVGFACLWDPDPVETWSGTPWQLLQALQRRRAVPDLGPSIPTSVRRALRVAYLRRANGRWVSPWKHGRVRDRICAESLRRAMARTSVDAVIEIQDLAVVDVPYWLVQDLSYDALLDLADAGVVDLQFPGMSGRWLERRRSRQRQVYAGAAGFFPMSAWLARQLVERSGVPEQKVTVVRPGASAVGTISGPRGVHEGPGRLLFVGRDFERKGGDLVLESLRILRDDYDPRVQLTVCGPPTWPLAGAPPDGVTFAGAQTPAQVAELYGRHDLLVLPSRFEAFGIVFLEALAHGLPCIGRNAYAMPEIVEPGRNGELVSSDDPDELAQRVVAVLEDRPMRERVGAEREEVARNHSWDRAAGQILEVIDQSAG
jgi:glycosyltransferase involved in cell wall biosynthesis